MYPPSGGEGALSCAQTGSATNTAVWGGEAMVSVGNRASPLTRSSTTLTLTLTTHFKECVAIGVQVFVCVRVGSPMFPDGP